MRARPLNGTHPASLGRSKRCPLGLSALAPSLFIGYRFALRYSPIPSPVRLALLSSVSPRWLSACASVLWPFCVRPRVAARVAARPMSVFRSRLYRAAALWVSLLCPFPLVLSGLCPVWYISSCACVGRHPCPPVAVCAPFTRVAPAPRLLRVCPSALGGFFPASRARGSLRSSRAGVRPAPFRRGCSPPLRFVCAPPPPRRAPYGGSRGSGFPAPNVAFAPAPSGRAVALASLGRGCFSAAALCFALQIPLAGARFALAPALLRFGHSPHLRRAFSLFRSGCPCFYPLNTHADSHPEITKLPPFPHHPPLKKYK